MNWISDPSSRIYPQARILNFKKDPEAIRIGAHTHIIGELLVYWKSGSITIGRNSYVSAGTRIWSQASVTIGDHVLISHNVDIHDTNGHPLDWKERRLDAAAIYQGTFHEPTQTVSAPVVIEDDAWIGFKSSILKGVHIGRGAIVGAAAVVTRDVEPFTIVAGNPARVIRRLDHQEADELHREAREVEAQILQLQSGPASGQPNPASFTAEETANLDHLQHQLQEKEKEIKSLTAVCQERLETIERIHHQAAEISRQLKEKR